MGVETNVLCPSCGGKGWSVKPVTIESLVTAPARTRVGRPHGFRFCANPSCEVVYYHPESGQRLHRQDVNVRVGQKETAPPRTVCYCFHHTVEEIEAEVQETGTSRVLDSIAEKCRQGLDRCEETNPQGACCLGQVLRAMKDAQARTTVVPSSVTALGFLNQAEESCCGRESSNEAPRAARVKAARLAPAGAILAAIVASACCWLPLVLLAVGVSAAGASSFFVEARPYFLAGAAGLLALGFYLTYFRRPACGPDAACAVPSMQPRRWNRLMLWVATVIVAAIAFFPSYGGALVGGGSQDSDVATPPGPSMHEFVFAVEGMHCAACAVGLKGELIKIEGVHSADVNYATKTARVVAGSAGILSGVRDAAARWGYSATLRSDTP